MIIKKVLNNNVVLSEKDNHEIVIMGKGIAFGKRVGDLLDKDKIDKTFHLQNYDTSEKFKELLVDVPMNIISLSYDIIEYAKDILNIGFNDFIYITLTDHLNFDISRSKENVKYINSLTWEIKKYYSKEYNVGLKALELIKEELNIEFSEDEAANIALHLVNAKQNSDHEMGKTIQAVEMTQDILNIIRYTFNKPLDESTISFERFITHLKFFFQRISKDTSLEDDDDFIYKEVKKKYYVAYECVKKIEKYLLERHKRPLTKEEKAYLTIHIQKITQNN